MALALTPDVTAQPRVFSWVLGSPVRSQPVGCRGRLARRRVQLRVALAIVWLLDAALQYQPYMFTKGFVTETLASTAAGNPSVIAQPITWAADLMVRHIGIYNGLFATTQLLLGVGLIWRPTVKLALAASMGWAVSLWWLGEGLGGVLLSTPSPFKGAPGGVILYALVALLVWPRREEQRERASVAASGPLGGHAPKVLWLVLWGSFAYFLLQPANRSARSLSSTIAGMAPGEPAWVRRIDATLARVVGGHGTDVSIVVAVLCALVAVGALIPGAARPAIVLAVVISLAIWVVEDLGGIFTGHGTDPNTGILLVLLAAAFWPNRNVPDRAPTAPVAPRPRTHVSRALLPALRAPSESRDQNGRDVSPRSGPLARDRTG